MSERLRQIYLPNDEGTGASPKDFRARAAKLEAADKARRADAVQRMSNLALDPSERIRLWETVHRVQLPKQKDHALVRVIAARTGLPIEMVVAEQRRRFTSPGK